MKRIYVEAIATFDGNGAMRPEEILWEDGEWYRIERLIDFRPASEMKSKGHGDRYTVSVGGRKSCLYFERNDSLSGNCIGRWYVEGDDRE